MHRSSFCITVLCAALALAAARQTQQPLPAPAPGEAAPAAPGLEPGRRELLDLAFEAASALPLVPHHKDRARAQLGVIETCLHLDQPALALQWADEVQNWRRGEACADVARWFAARGRQEEARAALAVASEVLGGPSGGEEWQGWQRDRIRSRMASALMALGDGAEAARHGADLSASELGPIAEQRAATMSPEEADAFLRDVEQVLARGGFEEVRAALATCAGLHGRFHDDAERRELALRRLRAGWERMPATVRLEQLERLATSALEQGEQAAARAWLDEAGSLVTGADILPEARVPLRARLAGLRFRAGQAAEAKLEVDAALAQFEAEREQMLGTERADALRPLAEACVVLGDREAALALYRRVVELGVENPNARPRAEDLAATCCSLARTGLVPDEALRERLLQVRAALGPPW